MKCLVTGGAGFIGSHVVRNLLSEGHEVLVFDDLSGGFVENIPPQAEFVEGSITDCSLVNQLFGDYRFDYVYHLAAYAAEGLSHFIRHFNYTNNLLGSINLINASVNHKIKCFVFTSSIAVYGAGQLPMKEEDTPRPEDPYGISKYAIEQDLECARRMFGLNYIVFRPHNVYGEFQNIGDKYRNVIGIFMNQLMRGEPLTVFGDGSQTRAFSYIGDISPVIANSPNSPEAYGEVFNIGADIAYSVEELAQEVGIVLNTKPSIRHLEARNEVQHAYSSHEKARRFFPHPSSTSLRDGLTVMAKWALEHGPRKSSDFSNIEIPINLPSSWLKHAN